MPSASHPVSPASLPPANAPIGIISAMRPELAAVLAHMPDAGIARVAGRKFRRGHWQGHDMVAVLSRIGKVAAATTATVLVERFGVRCIVFTGVAGGLAEGVRVGDVVVARHLLQHDMDSSPIFPRYEIPLYGLSRFAADTALAAGLAQAARMALRNPDTVLGAAAVAEFGLHAPQVHEGLIVSGDRFIATDAASAALRAALPEALAVEMEGAAVAQVCHDYGVPFAAIRTISDRADDAAHVDFGRFTEAVASHYSVAVLEAWLSAPGLHGAPPSGTT